MAENKKKPNPVDIHVGSRVRLRRTMLGMSQEKLGEALGITFQQIQKYEKGSNRIGASRISKIAEVLKTTVSYFFEGLNEGASPASGMAEPQAEFVHDFMASPESIQLSRAFARIPNPKVRRRILELVRSIAEPDAPTADEAESDRVSL